MPSANLDIVRLVLLQAFKPLETYHLYGPPGPRELTTHRETYYFLSTCCLVSKDWYDVAAPLLYSTIVFSSLGPESKTALPSYKDVTMTLKTTLRHSPSLLPHIRVISVRWDAHSTTRFFDQPHSYPNLVQLGALAINWYDERRSVPDVVALRKRLPRLEVLRVNLVQRNRSRASLLLPETLKKLSIAGPDGFLDLQALSNNKLPRLVELELEAFGGDPDEVEHFFFYSRETMAFFQKFGSKLLTLSLSVRDVDELPAALLTLLPSSLPGSLHSCPAHVLAACPSLRTLAIQGLDLLYLLPQGHTILETLEVGLVEQPSHIAGFDLQQRVRLEQVLPQLSNGFQRSLFPLLKTIKISSLDFRLSSHREDVLLQQHLPVLVDQGLRFLDSRGIEWTASSWPNELLDSFLPVRDLTAEEENAYRAGVVFRLANRLIYGRDEFTDQEQGGGRNDDSEDEGDEDEDAEEEERNMPPGMAEALEAGMKDLLEGLDVAMDHDHLRNEKRMEIMEEKDLTQYAEVYAEEEMESRGKGKKKA